MMKQYAGYAIAAAIPLSIFGGLKPGLISSLLAGCFIWLAFTLLVGHLKSHLQWQVGAMAVVGIVAMVLSRMMGGEINLTAAIIGNQNLITLLAAISFLALVVKVTLESERLPKGKKPLAWTYAGIHLFGSVINITMISMAGDRIARQGRLHKYQFIVLNRGLSSVVFWSPFTAAIAAVLHYQSDTDITRLIWLGLPLAGAAMLFTVWQIQREPVDRIGFVSGCPVGFRSLWIPALLVIVVLTSHFYFPSASVISLITAYSLGLVLILLALTDDMLALRHKLNHHCRTALPKMSGELSLFVAAGILAAGLGSLVNIWPEYLPVAAVTPYSAPLLVVSVVVAALIGIHPVAMVAALSVALADTNSDPELVATSLIAGWAIGVAVSPLSGIGVIIRSRYRVSAGDILSWNGSYGVFMLVVTTLWLALVF